MAEQHELKGLPSDAEPGPRGAKQRQVTVELPAAPSAAAGGELRDGSNKPQIRKAESDPGQGAHVESDNAGAFRHGVFNREKSCPDGAPHNSLRVERPHISLYQAIKDDKQEVVDNWLKYDKKRVRIQDKHGYTPVHYAAKFNRLEILRKLRETGSADVTVKTVSEEYTPLHLAARFIPCDTTGSRVEPDSNEESIIKYLKECKVEVNAKDCYDITPLHLACQVGNLEGVKILLEQCDADITIEDSNRDTPLHEACLHGEGEIIKLLLNKMKERSKGKINLLTKNHLGLTPFHLACRGGHLGIVKQLYSESDQPFLLVINKDKEGATALHLACQKDQPEVVEFLLTNEANISVKKNDGMTPVHVAAQYGCLEVMSLLLSKEVEVNIEDKYKQTPLHFATEYGKVEMMKLLVEKGAKKDAKDIDDYTPLLTAAEFGQKEAFEYLIEGDGVNMITARNKDKKSTLFLAAESNHPEIVKIILEKDEGQELLSVTDTSLNTPLHIAAEKGHVKPVEMILRHESKFVVNVKNMCKKTAMHLAAENGHTDVVKMLVGHNMMESVDEDGNTPLHLACTHGYEEVALCLMKNHADVGARNEVLWTPLDCAASRGHARIIERLVNFKAGSDIDPKDKLNTTPLHLAAKEGHVTAVETLIKYGARVSDRDYRGFNALDWAIENGHSNVAEAVINSRKWKLALSNHVTMQNGSETTPFRKLIQRMPDVAELVLKKCTITKTKDRNVQPDSKDYTVTFNYEFIEDKDLAQMWKDDLERNEELSEADSMKTEKKWQRLKQKSLHFFRCSKQKYLHFWGHSKLNHPLRIMVKSKRTDLLKHPLMYNLIEHKWNKFGMAIFNLMLIFHILLVIFLTAFALRLFNPFSPTCVAVSSGLFNHGDQFPLNISQLEAPNDAVVMEYLMNESIMVTSNTAHLDGQSLCSSNMSTAVRNAIDSIIPIEPLCGICGLSIKDTIFIKAAAMIIIVLSTIRLVLEILWLIRQLHLYFADLGMCTLVETPLFIFAIIFATAVFNRECFCPRDWQWQVGIAAVFLVWVDLILYMRRMRVLDTGIYVLMFEAIFKTFLRVIILTVLLVVTFALTFYMAFNQFIPRFARSPFATPFTSIWKTMTMATGELGYDDIFRQSTSDSMSDGPEIPFPAISYIMWVIFLILMPILFTNLLVGLAVDDIKGILDAAALTRLALRVDLVLDIEEYFWFLPCIRHHMNKKQLEVKPYKSRVKRFFAPILRLVEGENYCSAEHIANVLNPVKSPSEQQTQALMHEMAKMQQALSRVVNESIQKNHSISHQETQTHTHQEAEVQVQSHSEQQTQALVMHEMAKLQQQTQQEMAKMQEQTQQEMAKIQQQTQQEMAKIQQQTQQEMAKMQEQTQQEMAKIQEALQTLSQVVQESIQLKHSDSTTES